MKKPSNLDNPSNLLLQYLHAGVIVHAPDTSILYANEHACMMLELSLEQMAGKKAIDPAWSFLREDETILPVEDYPVNRVLVGREAIRDLVIGVNRPASGDRIWALVNAFPEFSKANELMRIVVTFTDITRTKAAEARQGHLIQVLRAIRNVNQLITQEKDADELVRRACVLLTETREYRSAWIGFLTADGQLSVKGESGLAEHISALQQQMAHTGMPPCCVRALSSSDIVIMHRPDAVCQNCCLASRYGDTAALISALRHDGNLYGVLLVALPDRLTYDEEEQSLFQEVAGDIGFALHSLSLEKERNDAVAELRESKAKLEAALASMTDAVFISDMDGRFINFNDAFATFHKFKSKNECATTLAEYPGLLEVCYTNGEPAPVEQWAVPQALRGAIVTNAEYILRRKDTGESWIGSYSFAPIRDQNDRIVGSVVVGRDITEQKKALLELENSRSFLKSIIEQSPTPMWISDAEGTLLQINKACCELLQLTADEVIGKYNLLHDVIVEEQGLMPLVQSVFSEARTVNFDLEYDTSRLAAPALQKSIHVILNVTIFPIRDNDGRLTNAVIQHLDVTVRKRAEEALRESELRFRMLVHGAPEGIFVQSQGRFLFLNPAMVQLLGAQRAEQLLGAAVFSFIAPEYHEQVRKRVRIQREEGVPVPPMVQEYVRLDGVRIAVETTAVAFRFENKESHLVFVRDITARRNAEMQREALQAQLQMAQKMESVGRLAGGIAHDFNNILMVQRGYCEMMQLELTGDSALADGVRNINLCIDRATKLIRQLLAFSRKQTLQLQKVDLNTSVRNLDNMLQRLIGEDVAMSTVTLSEPALVLADPGQLEQVIVNLVVNARDAMPQGGKLSVTVSSVELNQEYTSQHIDVLAGPYILLSVSDTGIGMDDETKQRIFEPFFTTKLDGKGTGLGLPTVYGIVHQSGGHIVVHSEPGLGSTFNIYLPRVNPEPARSLPPTATVPFGSNELVLIVEDDPAIRAVTRRMVERLGYRTSDAAGGQQALKLLEEKKIVPDVLLTDVVMPGMSGNILAEQVQQILPDVKVIYMSGYTNDVIDHHGALDQGFLLLQKPFMMADLAAKIYEALQGSGERIE